MHGISYLIDDTGKKKAVMIDLGDWGKLWEDFQDIIISEARKNEPTISLETLRAELEQENVQSA
jgi:hypothetical protein